MSRLVTGAVRAMIMRQATKVVLRRVRNRR